MKKINPYCSREFYSMLMKILLQLFFEYLNGLFNSYLWQRKRKYNTQTSQSFCFYHKEYDLINQSSVIYCDKILMCSRGNINTM